MFDKYWYRKREIQYIDAIRANEESQFQNSMQELIVNSGNTHTNETDNEEAERLQEAQKLKQQLETVRVRGQSLPSIPEGSKQSMNFEAVIKIQK